ncbi:restriction endonuclease subunit S [Psychroflexus halocasei]|uniref:Type I restriction enzyme, S subunit n=1 Tax=Psychroflexus halocasei TaxID=908615 RepID=A0A1H3VGD0_9FLAO|nr:restriction endonuclease subunit S [Psychroflexus halocasei]SDZ73238.1 type I restriction enzyme, S subunit [Psychroflexus halocasei]
MKHLIQHFNNLTLHPKNAKALKGLILQLAIQGKLTENWRAEHPDVESGDELIRKIETERKKLVTDGKIKDFGSYNNIKNKTYDFLPKSWIKCKLKNLASLPYGKGLSKKQLTDEGYDVFGANGIIGKYSEYHYESKKLLISCRGAYSGKPNISPQRCFITSNSLVCDFYSPELTDLHYYYYTIMGTSKNHIVSGSAQPQVTATNARELLLPLPPIQEQKAIVAIVEELFAEVEQLEQKTQERIQLKQDYVTSALQKLSQTTNVAKTWQDLQTHFATFFNEKANIKSLRESILQLAVQGKLTANWRKKNKISPFGGAGGIESASELLKRITAEKKRLIDEKKIKKEKPLPKITEDEKPFELPEGWVWCRLMELLLYSDAGKSPNCEKRQVSGKEWGVLTTTSIQKNRFDENKNKVLPASFKINKQQIVKSGDILITRAGPINRTGIACKVDKINYNLILSDKTIRLKYIENTLDPDFVVTALNSQKIRRLLLNKMIGMASSQVNISQKNIKSIFIPLPPLEEQKAIVKIVDELMAYCDGLERDIEQRDSLLEDLMASCLVEMEGDASADEELGMVAESGDEYKRNIK